MSGIVLDAETPLSTLEIMSASDARITLDGARAAQGAALLEVRDGAPYLQLRGLHFDGQVRIYDGRSVEFVSCSFSGTQEGRRLAEAPSFPPLPLPPPPPPPPPPPSSPAPPPPPSSPPSGRALTVSDGHVVLEDVLFEDHMDGAIEVNAGSLMLHHSILRRNEAARGGALLIKGGDVRVDNTHFELNTATGGPESGGAIYAEYASTLVLGNATKIVGSKGRGGSVFSNVRWTYELPTPLAHYVQAQGGIAEISPGTLDYDYPIGCSATLYGDSLLSGQSSPGCTDSCPGARYTPPLGPTSPLALILIFIIIFTLTSAPTLCLRSGFLLPEGNVQAHNLQSWHLLPSRVSHRDAMPGRHV